MKTALMIIFLFLGQQYHIELAITPTEQATGLMYRKEWTEKSQGMLFINQNPRRVSFWMKNTYLPVTIYYIDKNWNILEVNHLKPLDETSVISKSSDVQYILEIDPALESQVTQKWTDFSVLIRQELKQEQERIKKLQY